MKLFNLHTHQVTTNIPDGYTVFDILNVSPEDFASTYTKHTRTSAYSCGIHPWYADAYPDIFEVLTQIVDNRSVWAIGEIGLDTLVNVDMTLQEEVFRRQIELSIKHQKPLIIHCVKAWDQLLKLYKEYRPQPAWIIHGYRGKKEQVKQLCNLGFKISVGRYFNIEAVNEIPGDSLFCETDTSDIDIYYVYQQVANARGIPVSSLIEIIEANVQSVVLGGE